jgi:transcription elongation factor Elf1
MKYSKQRQRMHRLSELIKNIYHSDGLLKYYPCIVCNKPTLSVKIQIFSEKSISFFIECANCHLVDHVSLREPPSWMATPKE